MGDKTTVSYRVMDLRPAIVDVVGIVVKGAKSPEQAAEIVLGHAPVRSGAIKDLAARVRADR